MPKGKRGIQKGEVINPNGRPKGSANKETKRLREGISKMLEQNADVYHEWLVEIKEEEGAKAALDTVSKFVEFVIPKLQRTESQISGADGGPVSISPIAFFGENKTDAGDTDQ